MSRPQLAAQSRSSVASRTAFDLLTVESADESEDEQLPEQEEAPPQPANDEPPKPSKAALKKAAKAAARLEKQQRKRASLSPDSGASPATPAPRALPLTPPPEPASEPPKPVEHISLDQSAYVVVPSVVVDSASHAPTNGNALGLEAKPEPAAPPPEPVQDVYPSTQLDLPSAAEESVPPSVLSSGRSSPQFDDKGGLSTVDKPTNGHAPPTEQDNEKSKKRQNILTRTLWTFIMIGGFLWCLLMGHAYMVLLVMLCQTLVYREVTRLFTLMDSKKAPQDSGRDPWSKTLNWYFFAVTNYFLYGESIIYYFKHVVFADANLLPFATNHRIISFTLYTIGFMGFVMSLKKGYLKQQFGLFCWVHMSLLLIVVSSHFIMNNILEGLIWFWVPASLVICNDVFAYIWGITIGHTPLIKLSPKKTVEGFVGAFLSTIVFAILWGTYFSQFNYMICPVHNLGVNAWSNMECVPNPVFVWREWTIWKPVAVFLSTLLPGEIKTIPYTPYQIHLLFMACFASLVAPFGGFFASGFKRAFNIKDFGHSIPGHGGMTDRMDCQFLMGVFTYVYYSSLIREHHVTVGSVLQTIVSGLTIDEQLELIGDLTRYLERQGISVRI
ncbi:hypothetical protein BV25DRAFT_1821061 [Artomyces pyxidatus]|uniref:Uncharacterized protein n=1 Tax=Artomyces pyxidatus TaxID=48021 RepID=A0ACB8TC69_9AGAM|nr:hypothetical protein BV25DRAFT_1821061 [Artomyces pyxidatus]